MVVRPHLNVTLLDDDGEPRASTAVTIAKKTGAAFTQLLYAAESGGAALPGPYLTDSMGRLDLYTPLPERVQVTPSGGTARIEEFFSDPTDVVIQNSTVPVVLDGYSSNDDWSLTVQNDASQSKSFRVLNDGGDAVLRVQQDATGVNDLVSINLLDSSLPTTSLLHVAKAVTTADFAVGRFTAEVTGAVDGFAIAAAANKSVAGAGNATAGSFSSTRSTPASAGYTRGALATIASQVAGGGTTNVGFHATSALHSGGSSVRNDAGILIDGAAGWTLPILVVDTNGSTVLFNVDQVGGILAATTQPRTTNTYTLGSTGAVWSNTYTNVITLGTANASATGAVRLPNNTGVKIRNAANGADVNLIQMDASNILIIGAASGMDGTYVLGTTSVNLQIAGNVELSAVAAGVTLGRAAGQIGFYGSVGVTKPAAYTQTYATATKTHAVPGVTTLVAASGTADGTVLDVGTTFSQTGLNNNFKDIATAISALIVDVANTKQVLNSVIDDLQAVNMVG